MDNLTHSLIGVAIGNGAMAWRAKREAERGGGGGGREGDRASVAVAESPAFYSVVLLAAVFASNAPDLDFLLRFVFADPGLCYLVHHRGFTHSFMLLPVMAALSVALAVLVARVNPARAKLALTRSEWAWVAGAAAVGVALHIGADACNEYGVHPFWPFDNRWYYGDFVFIMEPAFLLVLLPLAYVCARSRAGKALVGVLAAVITGLIAWTSIVPWPVKFGLYAWGIFWALLQLRWPRSLLPGISGVLAGGLIFGAAATFARNQVQAELLAQAPDERVIQFATSPSPGNPLLWRAVLATLDSRGTYRGRIGVVSLAPGLFPPSHVPAMGYPSSAPLAASRLSSKEGIYWKGEFARPFSEIGMLSIRYCRFYSYLKFTRAPFWREDPQEYRLSAGDLRFDRPGFSSFEFARGEPCLAADPSWLPPIQRLGQ